MMRQVGGSKIVKEGRVIEKLTRADFEEMCKSVKHIEPVAIGSSCSLVERLVFYHPNISKIQFRSDTIGEMGQPLSAISDAAHTGLVLNNIVIKCFIIQPEIKPKLYKYMHTTTPEFQMFQELWGKPCYRKLTSTMDEANAEYHTQKKVYSTTKMQMAPVCPDVMGLLIYNAEQFDDFMQIQTGADGPFHTNEVFLYLRNVVKERQDIRSVGIMIMDSVPATYDTLFRLGEGGHPNFISLCLVSSAIYCILFAQMHIILADGHLGNWMGNPDTLDVFALDLGRVLDLNDPGMNTELQKYIEQYFNFNSPILSYPRSDLQTCFLNSAFVTNLSETIRTLNSDCSELWPNVDRGGNIDMTPLKKIHKLFVLGACCDGFYNNSNYGTSECRFHKILQQVYNNNHFDTLRNIIENVHLDLTEYLRKLPSDIERSQLKEKLNYISQVIHRRTCVHQAMQAQPSLLLGNSDSYDDMDTNPQTGEGAGQQPACILMGGRLRKKKTRRYKRKRRTIKRRKTRNRKHKKS
jgi:hypothetical protein